MLGKALRGVFLLSFPLPLSGSLYRLLLELLELLFDKFKAVAQAHSVVLAHLQRIAAQCPAGAHEEGIKLYEQADVSAKIQTVLQVRYDHTRLRLFPCGHFFFLFSQRGKQE